MLIINKSIHINDRSIDVESRTVRFILSTETEDRHGTIIKADGWNLEHYNNNPVVLYGHASRSDDPDNVIGTGRVWVEDGKLWGEATFETKDENPKAHKVFNKLKSGTLRAVSVGFNAISYRWGDKDHGEDENTFYYTAQELVEFSVVPVGSNPDALQKSIDAIESHKREMKKERINGNEVINDLEMVAEMEEVLLYS